MSHGHLSSLWDGSLSLSLCLPADGQCSVPPTGHKLIMLSSSLADSWEESRRMRLSWSCRTRSDFFSNTITLVSISQVSLLVMEEEKHRYHLDALQIHSCEHILSVGDDIFVKLESAFQTKNRWDCLNLDLDIQGPLQPCQLLFGHIYADNAPALTAVRI